jgi:putative glutathione S-transferase
MDPLIAKKIDLRRHLALKREIFLLKRGATDSDVRLYATLVRFDAAYYSAFKTNRNRIVDFPNLWGYLRDLYQTPGFRDTTEFDAIKRHYHLSNHIASNDQKGYNILPKGPDLSGLTSEPHRQDLSNKAEKFLIH